MEKEILDMGSYLRWKLFPISATAKVRMIVHRMQDDRKSLELSNCSS